VNKPTYVRSLKNLREAIPEQVGGKAAGLAALDALGLTVPDAFVLLTSAYHRFVEHNQLQGSIDCLLDALRYADPPPEDELRRKCAELRESFASGNVPPDVLSEVQEARRQLGEGAVAVRSSARGEDSPEASFAGQYDSFLAVRGMEELLEAVRACWASAWSFRVLSYRRQSALDTGDPALAVVVQNMVGAERAGVMFTADPVTGRRDRVVLNAAWGLGESVVSGSVTPDFWMVDHKTGQILQSRIADKKTRVVATEGGTCSRRTPEHLREKPSLSRKEVSRLASAGAEIEAHMNWPQDVEWAIDRAGELHFLQSRPVTGLYPLPGRTDADHPLQLHYCLSYGAQGVAEPSTPMGIDLFSGLYEQVRPLYSSVMRMEAPPLQEVGGRLFWNMTPMLKNDRLRDDMLGFLEIVDPEGPAILRQQWERRGGTEAGSRRGGFGLPPFSTVMMMSGLLARLMVWMLYVLVSPSRAVRSLVSRIDRAIELLRRRAERGRDLEGYLRFVTDVSQKTLRVIMQEASALYVGLGALHLCRRKLEVWFDDATLLDPVLRWLPNDPTTEMGVHLREAAAESVTGDGRVDPGAPAFQKFLSIYGHRAITEMDVGVPRWREDPAPVVHMAESLLAAEDDVAGRRDRAVQEAESRMEELVARTRRERGVLAGCYMSFLLQRVRRLAGMRERPKFDMIRILDVSRRVLKRIGEQLCAQGRLDDAGDVFFLRLEDIDGDCDLREKVLEKRREYRREMKRRRVPLVISDRGEMFFSAEREADGLSGIAVSPGTHEGPVRVVRDPRGVRLRKGDVLVAPATDPGWTPLFLSAGALVMEVGGMMSHGSGVAREYGIPGVASVPGVTERLRDGQMVRVDGNAGEVIPLD